VLILCTEIAQPKRPVIVCIKLVLIIYGDGYILCYHEIGQSEIRVGRAGKLNAPTSRNNWKWARVSSRCVIHSKKIKLCTWKCNREFERNKLDRLAHVSERTWSLHMIMIIGDAMLVETCEF